MCDLPLLTSSWCSTSASTSLSTRKPLATWLQDGSYRCQVGYASCLDARRALSAIGVEVAVDVLVYCVVDAAMMPHKVYVMVAGAAEPVERLAFARADHLVLDRVEDAVGALVYFVVDLNWRSWGSAAQFKAAAMNGRSATSHPCYFKDNSSQPTRRQNGEPFCFGGRRGAAPLRTRSRQRHGTSA